MHIFALLFPSSSLLLKLPCVLQKKYCLFQVHPAPVDELERIAKENFLRIKVRKFELGTKEQRQLEKEGN